MALREVLERRGVLRSIRAKIRAEIFDSIDEKRGQKKKPVSDLEFLINELIREYLLSQQLDSTEHVFAMESGQAERRLARAMLAKELGISDSDDALKVPLLCSVISKVRRDAISKAPFPIPDAHSS